MSQTNNWGDSSSHLNDYNSQNNTFQLDSINNSTMKMKKKKLVVPLSIEDVFKQNSTITSSVLNPPLTNIILTPRSAKACLKLGINPEVLKIRDLDSFWEGDIDPSIQRMRHEAYIQRRLDLMKKCRYERKLIMNEEFELQNKLSRKKDTITSEMLFEKQQEQTSTLIAMELQRIEKMKRRQAKELESMVQFEVSRAKIQEEMAKRVEMEKKKELIHKRRQEKQLRIMTEERRLRELQRVAIEEAEEIKSRELANQIHERDRKLAEEATRKLEEQKKELRLRDIEKKRLNDEHRKKVVDYFESERLRIKSNLETIHEAEKKKQEALTIKQKMLTEQLKEKRDYVEKRLEENLMNSKEIEEKRKRDFFLKQEYFEMKRKAHLDKLEEERQHHINEVNIQEQRRQLILEEQKRREEENKLKLLLQFEKEEEHVDQVLEQRSHEHELYKVKKLIRLEMKKENVNRVSRVKDFQKLSTLKRIEDKDERVKTMLEQRKKLIADRVLAAAQVKRQKEMIAKVMEDVRADASKASKLVNLAMSGSFSIDDVVKVASPTSSIKQQHSKSIGNMSKKMTKLSSELLGLDGSQMQSSGFLPNNLKGTQEPVTYISPYEM